MSTIRIIARLRKGKTSLLFSAAAFLLVSVISVGQVKAAVPIPSGFRLILSDVGVRVYQKDYTGGYPDYVTIVDLRYGTLRNFTGNVSGESVFPRTLSTFWNDAVAQDNSARRTKVALNGTFFAPKDQWTAEPIAFGLKADWWKITYGYGSTTEYPGLVRTLAFDSYFGSSSIQPWSQSTFDSGIPNVVGGLDPTANKDKTLNIARTFVGVRDDNGDGHSETVIFFSSKYATQAWAVSILSSFGAGSKMMLDGRTSTGLIVNGVSKITPGRTIPQAFIVCAGRS